VDKVTNYFIIFILNNYDSPFRRNILRLFSGINTPLRSPEDGVIALFEASVTILHAAMSLNVKGFLDGRCDDC
jgi:hypothetical protein